MNNEPLLIKDGKDIPNAPANMHDKILFINPTTKQVMIKIPKHILKKYDKENIITNTNNFFIDAYVCFKIKTTEQNTININSSECVLNCKYIPFCDKAKKIKTKKDLNKYWNKILSNTVEPEILNDSISKG